jgi:hypothetical protein
MLRWQTFAASWKRDNRSLATFAGNQQESARQAVELSNLLAFSEAPARLGGKLLQAFNTEVTSLRQCCYDIAEGPGKFDFRLLDRASSWRPQRIPRAAAACDVSGQFRSRHVDSIRYIVA